MDPTTDPAEDEMTLDGAEINADDAVVEHTVSIKDYRKVLDSVTISINSGAKEPAGISNDGKIIVEGEKTLSLTIAPKRHWKVKSVKSDGKDWTSGADNAYSLPIAADTEVTIETVATYTFTLDATKATGVTLQRLVTDDEGKSTKPDFANGEIEKDGNDLKLVTKGYTADNNTITVSYTADGEDDATIIPGVEEEDPTSTATPKAKVIVYTIPANVLASLDSLHIVLVKNEQVAVTFAVDYTKVDVKVWGVKTPADGDTPAVMDYVDIPADGYKVIAGEKAKFKATAKDYYKITEVKAKDSSDTDAAPAKVCDATANGEYELTVATATEYSFVTEIDSEKSKTLTFNLAGDKNSATAKIKAVTLNKTGTETTDKVLTEDTTPKLSDFLTSLGLTGGALETGAEGVKIPNTVKEITVEVKAADGGDYTLAKINDTAVATTETTTADRTIAYASIGEVKVETAAVKSANVSYFTFDPNKKTTENPNGVEHIEVDTKAAAGATVEAVTGKTNTYKVKAETDTISIEIKADEGWELPKTAVDALKGDASVVDVASEVKDKKMVYTMKVLAKKLSTDADNPTDLGSVTNEKIRTFKVEMDETSSDADTYSEGTYTITPVDAFPATGATSKTNIPYNAKLVTEITATSGYTLKSVTATMGGTALPAIEILKVAGVDTAKIEIEKVTGDVKIKVETAEAYSVTLGTATGADTVAPNQPGYASGDKTWAVKYDGKYKVNVTPTVAIADLSAEIKDGETVVGRGKKISGELQLWMTKAWAGKELTVDVKAKDAKIAELVLQVNKQRSTLNIKSEGTIKQDVASTAVYEIETDGEKLTAGTATVAVTGDLGSNGNNKVTATIDAKGNLAVTVAPAKFTDVNTVTETGTGDEKVRTVAPKTAVITITDGEDSTLKAKVTVTANAIFDTESKPSVSLVDGGASDTVLNVNVGMDGVITPKNSPSKVYYVITATAKTNVAASGDTPASNRDADKLEETVTRIVEKRGSSQREALQVGKSTNLGEGAEWAYDVTARAVYALDGARPSGTAGTVVTDGDISALSDKLETSTVTPLFEAGLKLTKDSKKKPASTLYTGQKNLYIATPQWSKKNVNYKITDAYVSDSAYGVTAVIDDAGDLVVTSVAPNATLGKHTLTVTAKADQTTNHTMYASRATITVTVVPGINSLSISNPGNQIFKQANKAATYKVTPVYTKKWDGKKNVDPKTKKVTWSIVGADSTGSSNINSMNLTAAPAGITIKNGTVTVAKNFTVDARHPKNNQFRVLVQAADFAGNTTAALSDPIYITSEALDVSNLVIAKYNNDKDGYDVIAVKEGTKTAKAVDVKAEDIDDAFVYATAKAVAPGFVSDAKWDSLGVVDEYNLTYAPTKGNVLTVDNYGVINVLASGKKATITVTTTDGSKKKNSIALNLGYTDADPTAALGITAYAADDSAKKVEVTKAPSKEADAVAKVEKDYTLPGVAELAVNVYVAQRDDKGTFKKFERANQYQNYKLTVKGGKVDYNKNGYATVYTTSKVTTLNLTVGAGKAAKKYTYVLTNLAYNETVKPKVTVKNTLHTYGSVDEQKVTMVALNGKESFGDNKYAKVELDRTAMPKSGTTQYTAWNRFNNAIDGNNYIKLNKESGEFVLEFNENAYEYDNVTATEEPRVSLTAGTYKLKVTVGEGATAAAFKATTQPVNVNVKVVANKAFTFKPTTSYTINKVDGGAVLTGKTNVNVKAGETAFVEFTKLQNANVDGKSNLFTHYFKLESDPITGTQRLALNTTDPLVEKLLYETKEDGSLDKTKPIADPDLSALSKDKKNLTGYVTYIAAPSVNYYTNRPAYGTVKITVKIAPEAKNNKYKASQKYVPEGGTEIGLKKDVETQVNILVNGAYVSVAHAIVDDSKAKSNAAELTATGVNAKGQIVLKAAADLDATKKGGYSINLLIVPASSFYAKAITDTAKAEDKKALIERYGTPVKVTVVAKEKPKATPDPSITKEPVTPEDPETEEKEVASIVITTSDDTTVTQGTGGDVTFTAVVTATDGTDITDDNVSNITWSVATPSDEEGTTFDSTTGKTAKLTVSDNEAVGTLTVKASVGTTDSNSVIVTIASDSNP